MAKVTQSQINQLKALAQQYQASKWSWWPTAAQDVTKQAAWILWIKEGSSSYQNVMNKAVWIDQTNMANYNKNIQNQQQVAQNQNLQNIQTQNQNIQNLNTQRQNLSNIYWEYDLWGKSREQYTGEGVKLSTGEHITNLEAFWWIDTDKYNVFWQQAKKIEQAEPWFLAARNDAFAMDILKNNPAITSQNADKIILEYLKTKDSSQWLYTWDRWEVDVQNTIESIKSRMWYLPTAEERLVQKHEICMIKR